jgi:hypothetical protein
MRTKKEEQMMHDKTCHDKAVSRGQRTFTLVEQDVSTPRTILWWIMENFHTSPDDKLMDAFEDALAMKNSTVEKKQPD